jgi:hypothetical protein
MIDEPQDRQHHPDSAPTFHQNIRCVGLHCRSNETDSIVFWVFWSNVIEAATPHSWDA